MQISGRFVTRCGQWLAPVILAGALAGQDNLPVRVQARRVYLTGNSERIRSAVKQQIAPHSSKFGGERQLAEMGAAPPACGTRIHAAFARYCTTQLKVALTPCDVATDHALCSTAYLTPTSEKIFWRLRYHHRPQEVSVELEALRRGSSGRLEEMIPEHANEFEELFDLLVRTSRCEVGH